MQKGLLRRYAVDAIKAGTMCDNYTAHMRAILLTQYAPFSYYSSGDCYAKH